MLSPLDDRYIEQIKELEGVFGEERLIYWRVEVEKRYLEKLKKIKLPNLKIDYKRIKEIEKETRHDVKAIEYWLREKLHKKLWPWLHFGLTSEDVNNLAYSKMLIDGKSVIVRQGKDLIKALVTLINQSDVVIVARTHGQSAIPTIMAKELLVHTWNVVQLIKELEEQKLSGKLSGAVGTLAGHYLTLPKVNWLKFSKEFVKSFDLEPELLTTQILPTRSWVKLFDGLKCVSLALAGLAKDLWLYVMLGYFKQKQNKNEIGSSTMPQKVNPIDLENSEGNGELAASLFEFFSRKLSYSRMQRDLSDSTVRRNFGLGFGHLLLALKSLDVGIKKLAVNRQAITKDLNHHPEIMAEAEQMKLRKEGIIDAYERVKSVNVSMHKRHKQEQYLGWTKRITKIYLKKIRELL